VRWFRGRRRRAERPDRGAPLGHASDEIAELEERFAAVESEEARDRDRRLARRLDALVARQVPVRVVEAVPAAGAARLRFADGTAVFARGAVAGDVGLLASWVNDGSVSPARCSTGAGGTSLEFASPVRRRSVSIIVTGFDQPE
jgi:hypothetical protein